MLIFGSNTHVINETKNMLKSHFDMKDFSETNFILKKYKNMWWNISWSITLCWENIIFMITAASFDSSVHLFLVNNDDGIFNQKDYACIIGSLRYATDCTRPDIAYAVGVLSRFTNKPSRDYWLAIERVIRYLIGTKSYGLLYKKYPAVIGAFVMLIGILCQVILSLPRVIFLP